MKRKAPSFWYENARPPFWALRLLSYFVAAAARRRAARPSAYRAGCYVVCVGNVTLGGVGKTPVVESLAQILKEKGISVGIVCRGYGGRLKEALQVDPVLHSAAEVGDEAYGHAKTTLTAIGPRARSEAMALLEKKGIRCLLLDDGYQDSSVHKDFYLLVVDGSVGFGNGFVLPAGPLREDLWEGLMRADAILIAGEDRIRLDDRLMNLFQEHSQPLPPLWKGVFEISSERSAMLKGRRVISFCGIGRAAKFFESVRAAGAVVIAEYDFGDHAVFRRRDLKRLAHRAEKEKALLVTTTKDALRLEAQSILKSFFVLKGAFRSPDLEAFAEGLRRRLEGSPL